MYLLWLFRNNLTHCGELLLCAYFSPAEQSVKETGDNFSHDFARFWLGKTTGILKLLTNLNTVLCTSARDRFILVNIHLVLVLGQILIASDKMHHLAVFTVFLSTV